MIIDKDGYQLTRKYLKAYRKAMALVPVQGLIEVLFSIFAVVFLCFLLEITSLSILSFMAGRIIGIKHDFLRNNNNPSLKMKPKPILKVILYSCNLKMRNEIQ